MNDEYPRHEGLNPDSFWDAACAIGAVLYVFLVGLLQWPS